MAKKQAGAKRPDEELDERTHGAHGRGVLGREKVQTPTPTTPDLAKGSDRGGSSAWGSEAAGGSVADKRSRKKK